jgi:hypothetical protein
VSRHFYSTNSQGKPITVLCGWDQLLQQYFLVIEYENLTDDISDEDAEIYSNLFDETALQTEIVFFNRKLDAFGITLPAGMMDQVRVDRLNNDGNRHCLHHDDGSYISDGVRHFCH